MSPWTAGFYNLIEHKLTGGAPQVNHFQSQAIMLRCRMIEDDKN